MCWWRYDHPSRLHYLALCDYVTIWCILDELYAVPMNVMDPFTALDDTAKILHQVKGEKDSDNLKQ